MKLLSLYFPAAGTENFTFQYPVHDIFSTKDSSLSGQSHSSHIQALDIHKAVGIDEIPTRFVKAAPYGMAVILTTLINMSILTCTFPDLWKTAIVTPVQKSKQNNSLSNFRPISVLPVASKILERLVFDAMVGHLLKYKLLSTEQSGFRPGHSTQDVLLCVTDSWLKAIDDGKYVGAVFLDLAKAFDCVDHEILLKKLTCYGVRGDALKWMQSFLYGRFQRVSLHGTLSAKGEIKVGVPQGFGPLLFSIYVNDLPTAITDVDVNADDTELPLYLLDLVTKLYPRCSTTD